MADKKSKYSRLASEEEPEPAVEENKIDDVAAGGTIELQVQPTETEPTETVQPTETTGILTTDNETEQKYHDPPLEEFEVLTTDISFFTKFQLQFWKNSQIQFMRHPLGIALTYGIPFAIMLILVAMTAIDTQHNNGKAYGFEFDYLLSNTGDAADYGTNYPMHRPLPWPDASAMHMWIKYFVCVRNPYASNTYAQHQPSYLAIVHPDIYSNSSAVTNLLNIMGTKYGDSSTYLSDFYENALNDDTWFSETYRPERERRFDFLGGNDTDPGNKPFEYNFCWDDSNHTNYLNFTEGSLLKFFTTEQELEEYITSPLYANPGFNFEDTNPNATRPVGAAIVFNDMGDDSGGFKWKYTLRVNMSAIPSTKSSNNVNIFERNFYLLYGLSLYYYTEWSGFITLQTWIDEAIMEYMIRYGEYENNRDTNTVNGLLDKFYSFTREYSKGAFMFPVYPYLADSYWSWIGPAFAFYLFIMFCYPITEILTILVDEKAKKIKETLKMMGATAGSYWLSWYCWFFISFTLIAVIIAVLGVFGNVFRYSSFGVIFLWVWLFCLATGMMCCWMSTWFDNPKTASLVGVVLFLIFLSFGTLAKPLSGPQKHGVCLVAPACFMIAVPNLVQYESSQIGINFENIDDMYNDFAFSQCLYMLTIDIFIYMVLNLYFDQVFPSKYGQKQVLWYFVLPSYWCPGYGETHKEKKGELRRKISSVLDFGANYQHFDEDREEAQLITIRQLTKTFQKPGNWFSKVGLVKAVQGVSLDVYRGEIFCLLGHNGAGKSTTIGMMTGLLPITSGNAWVLNHDINDPVEMGEVRKHLGICPQHDVLWDRMSTEEHLWFFARLKGVPKDKTGAEVATMLKKTHLDRGHNQHKFPTQMSGGQRRKLSLGIALIGGSQIVFLDEPTSGMDPQNRRITWELIQSEKRNRSIILTTHFMDEADILGDRIAIMGGGKVKCCGSSSFLKQTYGVGYTLTVSLDLVDDSAKKNVHNIKDDVDKIVFDHVIKAEVVTLAGSEVTYRLPFESTAQFATLFNIFDDNKANLKIKSYGISVTTLEEVFLKVGHDEMEPIRSNIKLEDEKEGKEELMESMHPSQLVELGEFALSDMNRAKIFFIHIYAILYKRFLWSLRDKQSMICTLFCPFIIALFGFGVGTIQMGRIKAAPPLDLHPTNWYPSADEVYIPTAIHNESFPNTTQGQDWWRIPDNFYSNNTFHDVYDDLAPDNGELFLKNISVAVEDVYTVNTTDYFGKLLMPLISVYPSTNKITYAFQDWLLEMSLATKPIYNAFLFLPYSMTANQQKRVYFGINGSASHGLPITNNLWNNWVIQYVFDEYESINPNISITSHPLPPTYAQAGILAYMLAFQQSIYFVMAFSFIPASAMYFICNEKASMSKHQQLVSGVSYSSYWIANYITDVTVGSPTLILVICLIYIFNSVVYENAIGWFILVIFLFLWSSTPFTYLLSFLFSSPSKAQFTTIILYMVLGMVLGLVCLGLDFMSDETEEIATNILRPIFRLFPPFILCESLFNIGIGIALFPFSEYSDWEVLGRNTTIMAVEGVAYFSVVLIIEYLSTYAILLRKCGLISNMPTTQRDDALDDDVWGEKQRIKLGIKEYIVPHDGADTDTAAEQIEYKLKDDDELKDDSVVIAGLRKVFKQRGGGNGLCKKSNKFEAVKGLFFGVKQSECFGFLGVNGAGKSTTLSTLTGAQYPSSGTAFICGNDIVRQQLKCRRYMGYVPQFDALFDLLTSEEHLKFYGMVKGLKADICQKQSEILLSSLTLQKYRNKLSHTYSGGNKRKLSVAVAMIGNPPVVFLDEPSTGMDPVSRRAMWTFISSTMNNRSVILTTHSMEECEALCNRIGIMVNGQIQCIGNNQHLKTRFGKGYQLDLDLCFDHVDDDDKEHCNIIESIQNKLKQEFGEIKLIEHNSNRISYQLLGSDENNKTMRLGPMFNVLQDMKNNEFKDIIDSYGLSQTTLEQVFLRMAKKGNEMKQNEL